MSLSRASIIIPTLSRPSDLVSETINSVLRLKDEITMIDKIILIDQNIVPLKLNLIDSNFKYVAEKYPESVNLKNQTGLILHVQTGPPSVTISKNKGLRSVNSEIVIFYDDDVTVHAGNIKNYLTQFSEHPEAGFFGGREILDRKFVQPSSLRDNLRELLFRLAPPKADEQKYLAHNKFVGRLRPNSFFLTDFDVESENLIQVDVVRGCNWAARMKDIEQAGFFDEFYQGTAIREEPDLQLRIGKIRSPNYFTSKSAVTHHRQLGGCNNLSQSISVMKSKLKNELYFQKKFFPKLSSIYFFIRQIPLAIEHFRLSRGLSLLLLLQFTLRVKGHKNA